MTTEFDYMVEKAKSHGAGGVDQARDTGETP